MLEQKAQQHGHGGQGGGLEEGAVVQIVPGAAAESHGGPAGKAPQKAADEAEHVIEGQHAQQPILRLEGQQGAAVVGAAHEGGAGEHHGLRSAGGAGGEEQHPARAALGLGVQIGGEVVHQIGIAPQGGYVRLLHHVDEGGVGGVLAEEHQALAEDHGGEDLYDAVEAPVTDDAPTEARLPAQLVGPGKDPLLKLRKGAYGGLAAPFVDEGGPIRRLPSPMAQKLVKACKPHSSTSL